MSLSLKAGAAFHTSAQAKLPRRAVKARAASSDPMLQKPAMKPAAPKPAAPEQPPAAAEAPGAAATPAASTSSAAYSGVSIEYQRQQAKAMQKYFASLKYEQAVEQNKVLGWTRKNEIGNGRWVMMGLAVGLLTEYATGVSFIGQIKLMASYLGIVDLDY